MITIGYRSLVVGYGLWGIGFWLSIIGDLLLLVAYGSLIIGYWLWVID